MSERNILARDFELDINNSSSGSIESESTYLSTLEEGGTKEAGAVVNSDSKKADGPVQEVVEDDEEEKEV